MFNYIDLIGILIVLICAFFAYKRGFVKTFFGFISTFVAIALLSYLYQNSNSDALCDAGVQAIKDNTGIDEWLESTLTTALKSSSEEEIKSGEVKQDIEENNMENALKDLPENIKNFVGLEEYKENAKNTVIENSKEIILKILSWVVIYLSVRIILFIICLVCNGIMSIPFLKQINNLTGLVLGLILGLFRIYVILAIISFIITIVPITPVVDAIKASLIIGFMYENNLLVSLIF